MSVEGLTLRIPKGSPLTPEEGDDNWQILSDAIDGLEARLDVSLNADGSLKNPPIVAADPSGGTDDYAIAPSPAITNAADLLGRLIIFKADVANIGAATLTVNAIAAAPITKFKDQPLESNDIKAGQYVAVSWDGTNYEMQSFPGVVQPSNYVHSDTGAADAYVIAQSGIVEIPSVIYNGFRISFKAANASTGASTLQAGSIAAISIKKNVSSDLEANDIRAGQIITVEYDGTNYQLQTPPASKDTVIHTSASTIDQYNGVSSPTWSYRYAHGWGAIPQDFRAVLVCQSADGGWAAGDEVTAETFYRAETSQEKPGVVPYANSTYIGVSIYNGALNGIGQTTGLFFTIDETKWKIRFYARRQ